MITYRKLTWFVRVFGQFRERYTDRLHRNELMLWRASRLGENK